VKRPVKAVAFILGLPVIIVLAIWISNLL